MENIELQSGNGISPLFWAASHQHELLIIFL